MESNEDGPTAEVVASDLVSLCDGKGEPAPPQPTADILKARYRGLCKNKTGPKPTASSTGTSGPRREHLHTRTASSVHKEFWVSREGSTSAKSKADSARTLLAPQVNSAGPTLANVCVGGGASRKDMSETAAGKPARPTP